MPLRPSRRQSILLITSALSATAGCLDSSSDTESTNESPTSASPAETPLETRTDVQFTLWNRDDELHTISLIVTTGGEQVVEQSRELSSHTSVDVFEALKQNGTYTVTAQIETGAKTTVRVEDLCAKNEYLQIQVENEETVTVVRKMQTVDPQPTC
ncbi:hypothetical protein [Halopelagius fulvigenes]|uniref:Ig-like domain-containing protein n=1 Tax=Halopelagius fulvigenes TaxID=1198324 RepID=A0ABD5U0R5_9EURY